MEKRTAVILILILFLIAIVLLSIIFISTKDKNNLTGQQIKKGEQETEDNQEEITNFDNSGGSRAGGAGGSGSSGARGAGSSSSGAGGSGVIGDVLNNKVQLPSDLYDVECGFYFSEFGACAGTCPSGKCTEEGRSCYCKKA